MNTPEESDLLQDFGSILEDGGTTLTIVPEIQRMKFAKNIWNVTSESKGRACMFLLFFGLKLIGVVGR